MIAPRLSIIITNYNYGRFLQDAIDSVIAQTYPNVELIVVDDGSTDHSREILAAAGNRIISVLKANGGQASAFNAGFDRSTGDIVLFLDADDMLLTTTGERVVAAFAAHPHASRAQYPLEVIDASGRPTGQLLPKLPLTNGDLRRHSVDFCDYVRPPTSGMAFPRNALDLIFPVPEESYRICADAYLRDSTLLVGEVVSLKEVGALYRRHSDNNFCGVPCFDTRWLPLIRNRLSWRPLRRAHQRRLAQKLGLALPPPECDVDFRDVWDRLLSLKFDPVQHPVEGDTLWKVAWDGATAALLPLRSPIASPLKRVALACCMLAATASPRWLARPLIEHMYSGTHRRLVRSIWRPLAWRRIESK